jgi:drug/metabolite transporter (DMT)-like permease
VPGVRASQLLNVTPIAGLAAAVVFLAERPGAGQIVGGVLVVLAVALLVRFAEGSTNPDAGLHADPVETGPLEDVA